MADVKPYTISVSEDKIERLQQKLALTDFPDELDEAGWDYGTPLVEVKKLVSYWRDGYDWRKHEAEMNKLPNYTTSVGVDGFGDVELHFIHQKSKNKDAIPLLFVHGWPGNFMEVSKLLPLLAETKEGEPAFDIVAPSLPNAGFSPGIEKKGFGIKKYAETFHKLMLKLGYDKYVTQGGDWGFWITRIIGRLYPESCKASHINMVPPPISGPVPEPQDSDGFTENEKSALERLRWFRDDGGGYSHEQFSKPHTVGYGLQDSPSLLLAWIWEKLHDWTDEYPWTQDEILTWVSLYYFSTAGPAANVRIYYEAKHEATDPSMVVSTEYIPKVKLGIMFNWKDMECSPKRWARKMGDVVFESDNDRGGHFAAWEKPELVARDLKEMFREDAPATQDW